MKIKIAILEKDISYLKRIVEAFNMRYAEKLEVYSFTNEAVVYQTLETTKIDVLLANDFFEIDMSKIPSKCGFAYLVDSSDIESLREQQAICKFQRAELIYKQILSIYSENVSVVTGVNMAMEGECKVMAFLSPSGGTGSSTAAAACAIHMASRNKKVMYLNFEHFGNQDIFFHGDGQGTFTDLIYAIKSKKGNLSLKIESTVRHDPHGVYYFAATPLALDMEELSAKEILRLISEIKMVGEYDYIILDMDFSVNKEELSILDACHSIILVSDGSPITNAKMERAITSINIVEQQEDKKILMKCGILYNRFSSHGSSKVDFADIKEIGGIKRYEGYTVEELLKQLGELTVFDALM